MIASRAPGVIAAAAGAHREVADRRGPARCRRPASAIESKATATTHQTRDGGTAARCEGRRRGRPDGALAACPQGGPLLLPRPPQPPMAALAGWGRWRRAWGGGPGQRARALGQGRALAPSCPRDRPAASIAPPARAPSSERKPLNNRLRALPAPPLLPRPEPPPTPANHRQRAPERPPLGLHGSHRHPGTVPCAMASAPPPAGAQVRTRLGACRAALLLEQCGFCG